MKKVALIFAALLMLLPLALGAQVLVDDEFIGNSTGDWVPGWGDWGVRGGMLIQRDTETGLARIDRMVPQTGEIEISFVVRYEAGGFADQTALATGQLHAGFGIHVGVENPPLGRVAWGAGESYLLWLNLDTRAETMRNAMDVHFGFRGQVYESMKNSEMVITPLNVDIQAALATIGVNLDLDDLNQFLGVQVPMKIRVNYDTGRILVMDPTNPSTWFYFDVEPSVLRGNYISFRTNSLALSFGDIRVVQR